MEDDGHIVSKGLIGQPRDRHCDNIGVNFYVVSAPEEKMGG